MLAGSIPGIPRAIIPTILLLYSRYWTCLTSICSHLTQFPCSSPGFVQFEVFLSISIVLIEFDVPPAYKPLIVLSSAHNSVLNNCFRSFREFFFSAQNGYCMQRWSNWLVLFISTLSLIIVFVLFIFPSALKMELLHATFSVLTEANDVVLFIAWHIFNEVVHVWLRCSNFLWRYSSNSGYFLQSKGRLLNQLSYEFRFGTNYRPLNISYQLLHVVLCVLLRRSPKEYITITMAAIARYFFPDVLKRNIEQYLWLRLATRYYELGISFIVSIPSFVRKYLLACCIDSQGYNHGRTFISPTNTMNYLYCSISFILYFCIL